MWRKEGEAVKIKENEHEEKLKKMKEEMVSECKSNFSFHLVNLRIQFA